jgi:hypothetical protein
VKTALIVPALAIALALVGCGSSRQDTTASTSPRPEWISDPSAQGQFGAIGIAPHSIAGQQQSLDQATATARSELARTLRVTVESAYKTAFTATSDWKKSGNAGDSSQIAHELSENVTKQTANEVLAGSTRRAWWTDPATGETYAWVTVARGAALGEAVTGKAQAALAERGLDAEDTKVAVGDALARALR